MMACTTPRLIENARDFGKVAVLLGGNSAERDISLLSGEAVLMALKESGIDAHPLDTIEENYISMLRCGGYNRVFNALHGRGGEDGVVQGLMDSMDLPYTGSGVLGSALTMDKTRSKQVWLAENIPTPMFAVLNDADDLRQAEASVGFPMILKPVHEGSSLGMAKVNSSAELEDAWIDAAKYDHEVLAELWVEGPEYTAGIVGEQVLPLIRLETPHTFYDYDAKYNADSTQYHCPCGLQEAQEADLRQLAMKAFKTLGASGWGRVDFLLDAANDPWLIEVNTVPGMTDHSLVPMAAKQFGWDFSELVWRILETSIQQDG